MVAQGYGAALLNNPQSVVEDFCRASMEARLHRALTNNELDLLWALVSSTFPTAMFLGCAFTLCFLSARSPLLRHGCLTAGVSQLIGCLCFLSSKPLQSAELLVIGRLLSGFSAGLTQSLAAVSIRQLSPPHLCTLLQSVLFTSLSLGYLLSPLISTTGTLGQAHLWHYLAVPPLTAAILQVAVYFVASESPAYHASEPVSAAAAKLFYQGTGELSSQDLGDPERCGEGKWTALKR
jgi:MFS family permease